MTTGSSVVMRSASWSHGTASENWDTSPSARASACACIRPEVQVCLLLLVGAEGDVVHVGLPGLRAVAEGNVGEPVALRRWPDPRPAGPSRCRRAPPTSAEPGRGRTASRHVDGVLDGCRRVGREVDQPCARGRDEQCQVDARRSGRPPPPASRRWRSGARSVSNVNSAMGTDGSSSVFQSTRHHVSVSVSPTATRKMSAPLRAAGPAG